VAGEWRRLDYGLMNRRGLRREVRSERAHDDPRVSRMFLVEPYEVLPVHGDDAYSRAMGDQAASFS
jgi:hypothetical protein